MSHFCIRRCDFHIALYDKWYLRIMAKATLRGSVITHISPVTRNKQKFCGQNPRAPLWFVG